MREESVRRISPTQRKGETRLPYLLRRAIFLIATLWAAITLNFFIPRLMPGNPASIIIAKFHGRLNPAALKALEIAFGLHTHLSLWAQYWQYLGQILHGNFGVSIAYFPTPVLTEIKLGLPWTLGLVGLSTIISFAVGTALGVLAAWRRGGVFDSLATTVFTFTSAFPYFWFALLVLYVFAFHLQWFPLAYGYGTAMTPTLSLSFALSVLKHGFLPALTIVVASMGGWLLGIRNNMMMVLGEDYITMARAKGLSPRRVLSAYAARNAILPNLTSFAMSLGFVVSGSILTEIVFSYPGIGYILLNAVQGEDYPLMQAIFFIIVVCVILANFLADVLYVLIDPRTREVTQ